MSNAFEDVRVLDDDSSAYALGNPNQIVDEVILTGNDRFGMITLLNNELRVGGVRLSTETMDWLCKLWMDERRVCPFCHEPGMDVAMDEQPYFEGVQTHWECEHCRGEYDLQLMPGSVPWEDPIKETR